MIVKNEGEQTLQCSLCGDVVEVCRKTMANPEMKLILMERLAKEHQECEQWADNPDRARIERIYKVRMAAELRSCADGGRKNGSPGKGPDHRTTRR